MLLGSTALTLVTLRSVSAAPIVEAADFGDSFSSIALLGAGTEVAGAIGGTDLFDFFQLAGFLPGQSVRVTLTRISALPAAQPSGEASSSGSEPEPSGEASSSGADPAPEPSGEASSSGSEPAPAPSGEASSSGSEPAPEPSGEASSSGAEPAPEPSGEASSSGSEPAPSGSDGLPLDLGFTLHLLDSLGAFIPVSGDSGPDASGAYPDDQVFGTRSYSFDLDTSTLTSGNLNFRIAYDDDTPAFYQLTVTAQNGTAVPEPSSLLPLAGGAAGLGFLAARRRRRKT